MRRFWRADVRNRLPFSPDVMIMSDESSGMRVVMITGAPGVGKTEVARALAGRYGESSAVIDTDAISDVRPWKADERLYRLIAVNLAACVIGFKAAGVRTLVVSGALVPGRAFDHLAPLLQDVTLRWTIYALRAAPTELAARARNDGKTQDADTRITWAHLNDEVARIDGAHVIDTTELTLDDVVAEITARELMLGIAIKKVDRDIVPSPAVIEVPVDEAMTTASEALTRSGFSEDRAALVVKDLLAAELAGTQSHGLIRVPEYVAATRSGQLQPDANPLVTHSGLATVIDACRAPGAIVHSVIIESVKQGVDQRGFALVALRRGAHIGQLRPLGVRAAEAGLVMLGFVNFSGGGQKVAPPGGTKPRLATNPILFACPAPPGAPIVVDMSSSATAEGAIRSAHLRAMPVAPGLLQDHRGRWVRDPGALYTTPASANIAPLGGAAAHKGYALAIVAEVLAGIVAGGGFVKQAAVVPGNAGLFVAFPASSVGRTLEEIGADVGLLEQYIASCPTFGGSSAPRLPGRGHAVPHQSQPSLTLPVSLWEQLVAAAQATDDATPLYAGNLTRKEHLGA
jgi:LDH2 family malate/lactate/ureidoglycolate dehydrogenase/broad-specificity NMP kinase